ncbi:hypothetical protein AVEN_157927-1, partial [Araneus ventricosus]
SPPKCPEDCPIDYDAYPCPACNCDLDYADQDNQGIRCSPPKCHPPCQMNHSTKPCPNCDCGPSHSPGNGRPSS